MQFVINVNHCKKKTKKKRNKTFMFLKLQHNLDDRVFG